MKARNGNEMKLQTRNATFIEDYDMRIYEADQELLTLRKEVQDATKENLRTGGQCG